MDLRLHTEGWPNVSDKSPVKTILQEISKSCKYFLARFSRSCSKSCKSCTRNEAFLVRYKNLARKIARYFSCKILIKSCKKIILQVLLERFLYLAIKASLLVQDLEDLVQDLTRKILARFAYFLQDSFTGLQEMCKTCKKIIKILQENLQDFLFLARKASILV